MNTNRIAVLPWAPSLSTLFAVAHADDKGSAERKSATAYRSLARTTAPPVLVRPAGTSKVDYQSNAGSWCRRAPAPPSRRPRAMADGAQSK